MGMKERSSSSSKRFFFLVGDGSAGFVGCCCGVWDFGLDAGMLKVAPSSSSNIPFFLGCYCTAGFDGGLASSTSFLGAG